MIMENRTMRRTFSNMIGDEKGMKPLMLKCGLALALTFGGFLYSHFRTKRIKFPSSIPKCLHSRRGSQANLGRRIKSSSNSCNIHSEGTNTLDSEEICISTVISTNSLAGGHSPRSKHNGDKEKEKDESMLPESAEFGSIITAGRISFKKDVEVPARSSEIASPSTAHGSCSERDDYHEQEIKQLSNVIRVLQERERTLELQLHEYCGIREQETAVMELQNRLKISNMETQMFNLKLETLQSENRRLEAQLADHAKALGELETSKAKVKMLKKKLRYEAEQNKEQIMNLKQKVSKLQDQESKLNREIQAKIGRLKELESETQVLREANMRLEMENSELASRLESTQMLAQAVLEDPEADVHRNENELLREKNESLLKEIEQLQHDRCSDVEELVYLRWINACLRHELRHYQPPAGKTVARDLSKSLSPTSEKKAKQLILEYANSIDGPGNLSCADSESSSQASYMTDSGELDELSPRLENPPVSKSKIYRKLMKLIRGKDKEKDKEKDIDRRRLSRATSREKSFKSLDGGTISPNYGLAGADGMRSEYATPGRNSLDLERTTSLKEEGDRRSRDSKEEDNESLQESSSVNEKSNNLVKYAGALKDSPGNANANAIANADPKRLIVHRRSATYSSF
ncbi:hypothetical protein HN51_053609 [Arachis hypogaea]|uniref:Protein CHUP1 n=1 Tax=Arachis hypogaea TaxID=3818 RepID=A0A444XCP6_ARAHY|nr:protein CHUP1, chloroplastic-like [Arachis ipaensis]XP_025679642.1 protein CHUP1, chloroplastic [Arachis hypogaea]QHN75991.1 Protein CHUP1 [Arachis hypogaea]QHN75992.1 Protein CHUP1 [Arachis hypogaea]RYQ87501.1 hypothetical protein Ahy_B09g095021 [Arachis hypogaea]